MRPKEVFWAGAKAGGPWGLAALSGFLLALCYPPFSMGAFAWLALVPVLAALWLFPRPGKGEGRRAFALGWAFGAVFFLISLSWLSTLTIPGWVLLSLYLALYPAAWAWITALAARPRTFPGSPFPGWTSPWRNMLAAIVCAAAWVATEWMRGWVFSGFGWNGLAVALVDNLPVVQMADLAGGAAISFLVVLVNAVALITLARLRSEIVAGRMRPHYEFGLAVLAVAAAFSYGARKMLAAPPASTEITFAGIQANIPISERRDPALDYQILETHRRLSSHALLMNPDLLIWPEAATPNPLFSDRSSWETVQSLAAEFGGDFLLGSVHFEEQNSFNSAIFLTNHGQRAQFYHKMHLVPFGEYVPLRRAFPLFAWVVGNLVPDDFDAGQESVVFEMTPRPVKLGVVICFEDTLPYIARRFALEGAQVLVTLTNDAWFLKSAASEQHRANSVLRTIETRRPLIRVANTGVTCAIDRLGRETHRLQQADGNTFFEGVLFGSVQAPAEPTPTFYTRVGDWFVGLCAAVVAGAALFQGGRRIIGWR